MSFTNIWGLWPDRCWNKHVSVRNVHLLSGGPTGLGLEALVAGCHNGGLVWLLYICCCGGGRANYGRKMYLVDYCTYKYRCVLTAISLIIDLL